MNIEGLRPLDDREAKFVRDYQREMAEAIPQMVKDAEKRAAIAAEARQRIMGVLKNAAKTVAPLIASEQEGERIPQGLMEFVLR